MVRIAVIVTARPSWAKLQTVCEALKARPDVEMQIVACASALLERYGKVVDVIKAQGFAIAAEVWSTYEGATLLTSAKETGALMASLADCLQRMHSDFVVVCADRHEVLGAAQAASYLHLPLVHLQGGERTGSIDDRVRDAITALSNIHFPCTERAAFRVYSLTGSAHIYQCGCPSLDLARRAQDEPPVTHEELGGTGPVMDLAQPFLVVLQHPDTRFYKDAYDEMGETLEGCLATGLPTLVFWPGQDAGMEGASKAIRERAAHLRTVRNLPPERYLRLLGQAACAVGNSSSFIREGAFLGCPAVNVGLRQWGRERAANVMDGPHDRVWIGEAIRAQVAHGRYASSRLYGDGHSGKKIAEVLVHVGAGIDTGALRQ